MRCSLKQLILFLVMQTNLDFAIEIRSSSKVSLCFYCDNFSSFMFVYVHLAKRESYRVVVVVMQRRKVEFWTREKKVIFLLKMGKEIILRRHS